MMMIIFHLRKAQTTRRQFQTQPKCELKVLKYLEESKKDLSVLENFPLVKSLYLTFNAILPSSAPVERLFSLGGIINRPHRRGIMEKTFERRLLLKAQ